MRTFKNQMQAFAIKQLLKYVERDPEVNAAKALKIIRKIDLDGTYGSSWDELEKCLQDPGNNWTRLVKKAYTEWDPHVRKKLFESLICNAAIIGNSAVKETSKKYGVHVPWTILMDPTSACNLKCTGVLGGRIRASDVNGPGNPGPYYYRSQSFGDLYVYFFGWGTFSPEKRYHQTL